MTSYFLFLNTMLKMRQMITNTIPAEASMAYTTNIGIWIVVIFFTGIPSTGTPAVYVTRIYYINLSPTWTYYLLM